MTVEVPSLSIKSSLVAKYGHGSVNNRHRSTPQTFIYILMYCVHIVYSMRSSRVVRASDSHANITTVMASIPAYSDKAEAEGLQMRQRSINCLKLVVNNDEKNIYMYSTSPQAHKIKLFL